MKYAGSGGESVTNIIGDEVCNQLIGDESGNQYHRRLEW